jgi:uncharacterized membrane protein
MGEISNVLKKALGTDEILSFVTEQNSKMMALLADNARQIKELSDSVTYANHQLLEVREKLEHFESSIKKPVEKAEKREKVQVNPVESRVLEGVVKSGSITASEAALLSGLSRTRASEVLNSLERKRLVLKEKRGKISFFRPNSDVSIDLPGGGN